MEEMDAWCCCTAEWVKNKRSLSSRASTSSWLPNITLFLWLPENAERFLETWPVKPALMQNAEMFIKSYVRSEHVTENYVLACAAWISVFTINAIVLHPNVLTTTEHHFTTEGIRLQKSKWRRAVHSTFETRIIFKRRKGRWKDQVTTPMEHTHTHTHILTQVKEKVFDKTATLYWVNVKTKTISYLKTASSNSPKHKVMWKFGNFKKNIENNS